MTDSERLAFVSRVLAVFDKYDCHDSLYWRVGPKYGGGEFDKPASFFVNVNDVFYWACADLEDVTPENVPELERAFADCKAAGRVVGPIYAPSLFACRVRKMRPQGAAYPRDCQPLWPLFDAAGPERALDFGNPKPSPKAEAVA